METKYKDNVSAPHPCACIAGSSVIEILGGRDKTLNVVQADVSDDDLSALNERGLQQARAISMDQGEPIFKESLI